MNRVVNLRVAVLAVSVLSTCSLAGWDGQRQGFLLGIGAGGASVSYVGTKSKSTQTTVGAVMTGSRIGYAWTNTRAIELYNSSLMVTNSTFGYSGVNFQAWSAEEAQSNSWFGGLGLMTRSVGTVTDAQGQFPASYGFGGNFGYGFEIAKHASIDLNLLLGFIDVQSYTASSSSWTKVGSSAGTLLGGFSVSINLLGY